mgnify:CR=1 FL=1
MTKEVLILSSSARIGSNSEKIAESFLKGAQDNGHHVELIRLANRSIGFCRGCLSCQKTKTCVVKDDMVEILEKMKKADVIALATPIYFYEMSGLLKTFLDRTNPLFRQTFKFRDIYFFATAADNEEGTFDQAIAGLTGWIECFPKTRLAKTIVVGGVTDIGDIERHPALKEAFLLGQNL